MTKDEALQLALDALHGFIPYLPLDSNKSQCDKYDQAITAINEALEAEEGLLDRKSYLLGLYDQKSRVGLETKDEPVAWGMEKDGVILDVISPAEHEREEGEYTIPLYTYPKKWIGLTDEEIHLIAWPHGGEIMQAIIKHTILQAEKLLKENNT